MDRISKKKFIEELKKNFQEHKVGYLVSLCGLKVSETNEFRKAMKKNNSICKVVQNRLALISAKDSGIIDLEKYLDGPTAIVFSKSNPELISKIILDFSKRLKKFSIKGIILDKKAYGPEDAVKLATLPSKDILTAQLLFVLQNPIRRFLFSLTLITKSLLVLLNKIQIQKSEGKDIIGGKTMSELTKEEVINYILNLSVLDLLNFIKEIEEKTGISASVAVAPAVSQAAPSAETKAAEEEKTEFDVILKSVGDKKINVIKVLRELTNLGLKEAKELIDNVPKPVKEGISKAEAEEIKKKFEEAGATVEIK